MSLSIQVKTPRTSPFSCLQLKKNQLTKKDFKDTPYYYKEYIGKENLSDFDGHLEIDANLGWVKFNRHLIVKGYIWAKAGSGIEAGLAKLLCRNASF